MKRINLLLLLTIATSLIAVGQSSTSSFLEKENKFVTHEIGINLFMGEKLNIYTIQEFNTSKLKYHFLNGIMYKRHSGKNSIRVGVDYSYSKFTGVDVHKNDKQQEIIGELRIGYERKLTTTKLQPFIAADLSLTYRQAKGTNGDWVNVTCGPGVVRTYDVRAKKVGISPAIGLKYHLIKQLSITIETNINLVYYNQIDYENPYISDNGLRLYFNPLRLLSVNYHF